VSGAVRALGPDGALAAALPGYEDRPEQRRMAAAVSEALEGGHALLVEAGTGTGKSLAYLLPALTAGLRVVISTGTRALQEQLAHNDVPLCSKLLGRPVDVVVLKGVSNYLCRRKLRGVELASGGLFRDDADLDRLLGWAGRTIHGDRAELAELDDDHRLWERVTTTPDARLGPRCPHFERCYVTAARRAAERASVTIVNHHLYVADLALRLGAPGAKVVPEHDAVIFDEAHLLEDVLTEHLGFGVSSARLAFLARDLGEALRRGGDDDDPGAPGLLGRLDAAGLALFGALRTRLQPLGEGRVALPEDLFAPDAARDAWLGLDDALADLGTLCRAVAERTAGEDERAQLRREELAALAGRAQVVRDGLATIAEPARDAGGAAPDFVYWGEVRGHGVALRAAPVDVSRVLARDVLPRVSAAVFTSATLTTAGRFAYTRSRLGLLPDRVGELQVDSPFDYAAQAMLYVPRDLPDPGAAEFTAAACDRIRALCEITAGRAFALFTSHRALREAEARLADLPWPVLVQGQAPPAQLIARFRATPNAVLLATGTFWAGVDVPGDALSLVVMDKLPFAPPTDPLTAARARRIEEAGGDPFLELTVPQAALGFRQGFGRLIRRRDDRGIVAVLDPRLVQRRYGQIFLDSLPRGLRRTGALEPLRRFFQGGATPAVAAEARA
jgi:ATP-dependent DNA helicase DinG